MPPLNYDYTASREYCESIGLLWLGDQFVRHADTDAFDLGMTQEQVDVMMRHCLWHIKWLFTPKTYKWHQRIGLALHFLFGR